MAHARLRIFATGLVISCAPMPGCAGSSNGDEDATNDTGADSSSTQGTSSASSTSASEETTGTDSTSSGSTSDATGTGEDSVSSSSTTGTSSTTDDSTETSATGTSSSDATTAETNTSDASTGTDTSTDTTGDSDGGDNVCDDADENASITLACPVGQVIDDVVFASYGDPSGSCGGYSTGTCDSPWSVAVVEALCLGRNTCSVPATNGHFEDPCSGTTKHLSVEVSCGTSVDEGTVPFKGVANSSCAARTALNVSWYYNWMQNENEPCQGEAGGDFVPMIWGHTGNEQDAMGIANSVAGFVDAGYPFVLGFNEPDNATQANIPVQTAIDLWPSFDHPDIEIGSPATAANANPGQAWFTEFMTLLNANGALRADFLAIHWYGWNAGSCDAEASQLESYIEWAEGFAGDRPIWITEWGCLNQSAPDEQTVVDFYHGALAVFARHPRVVRYAWYPWATNCELNDENGTLTALGEAYAAAPAYR